MHKAVQGSSSSGQRLSAYQQCVGLRACNSWEIVEILKPCLVCFTTLTSYLAPMALLDPLCCRYFMMYGISPFERAVNEAGGSLALAVIK